MKIINQHASAIAVNTVLSNARSNFSEDAHQHQTGSHDNISDVSRQVNKSKSILLGFQRTPSDWHNRRKSASDNTLRTRKIEKVVTTIMFTDIVKSTQLVFNMGDFKWIKVLQLHNDIIRKYLNLYAGRELELIGDSALVCFNDAGQALDCASDIQRNMSEIKLPIRIGIHTGEVLLLNEIDILGLTIHIASRITAIAQANQIVVSQRVKDIVTGSNNEFDSLGLHTLKGLPLPWKLYCLGQQSLGKGV